MRSRRVVFDGVVDSELGYHESRRCSRDTYPESYRTPSIPIYEEKNRDETLIYVGRDPCTALRRPPSQVLRPLALSLSLSFSLSLFLSLSRSLSLSLSRPSIKSEGMGREQTASSTHTHTCTHSLTLSHTHMHTHTQSLTLSRAPQTPNPHRRHPCAALRRPASQVLRPLVENNAPQ